MAATRAPRSSSAAAVGGDHLRFLRPGALARLRDARLRRHRPVSRPAPAAPSQPTSSSPPPVTAAGDGGESGPFVPYFVTSRLLAPRCPQRKKLTAGRATILFSQPQPSSDLTLEGVMEFLNLPDMVVAAH